MAIQMSENFKLLSKEALDGRISYKSLSEMVSMQDSYLYDGCLATIEGDATKKIYQWWSSNAIDSTLGKWRELEFNGEVPVFTQAEWNALSEEEKLGYAGKQVIISDDYDEASKQSIIDKSLTKFIAHRGYSEKAPENTRWSAKLAALSGFWGTECDIQLTSDGHFVLMHDNTVDRTTTGTGTVSSLTLEQIQNLWVDMESSNYDRLIEFDPNANLWVYDTDSYGDKNYCIRKVPTLEEYLDVCYFNNIHPVIELKEVPISSIADFVEIVKSKDMMDKCVFISFSEDLCAELKRIASTANIQPLLDFTKSNIDKCSALKYNGIDVPFSQCTVELVEYAHSKGLEVNCWTCDNIRDTEKLVDMKVDYITSNRMLQTNTIESKVGNIVHSPFVSTAYKGDVADAIYNVGMSIFDQKNPTEFISGDYSINAHWGKTTQHLELIQHYKTEDELPRIAFLKKYFTCGSNMLKLDFNSVNPDEYEITFRCFDVNNSQLSDIGWFRNSGLISLPPKTVYFNVYGLRYDKNDLTKTFVPTISDAEELKKISFTYLSKTTCKVIPINEFIFANQKAGTIGLQTYDVFELKSSQSDSNDGVLGANTIDTEGYSSVMCTCPNGYMMMVFPVFKGRVFEDPGWLTDSNGTGIPSKPYTIPKDCDGIITYFKRYENGNISTTHLFEMANACKVILIP